MSKSLDEIFSQLIHNINSTEDTSNYVGEENEIDIVQMQNKRGEWVPAIPEPFYGFRKKCSCGAKFFYLGTYQAHYALQHIILGKYPL